MIKANFKITKNVDKNIEVKKEDKSDKGQFEEYMKKSGVNGSFMIYRSDKKDEELGIDQL